MSTDVHVTAAPPPILYCGCDPGSHLALVAITRDGQFNRSHAHITEENKSALVAHYLLHFVLHLRVMYGADVKCVWVQGKSWIGPWARGAVLTHKMHAWCESSIRGLDNTIGWDELLDTQARRIVFGRGVSKLRAADIVKECFWRNMPTNRKGAPNSHLADAAVFALACASRNGVNIREWRR